jgi:adenylyltransferase/sulfurtransferase
LFSEIGESGQRRLRASSVTLLGCGALGSVLADTLVRAGAGRLRIYDRDYIERNNLQRQVLFDEDDLRAELPKAEAAARKLKRINPDVAIESAVVDVNHTNIERLCGEADLLLDGTDNFETRYLINDLAVKKQTPWIYGAVVGATGLCLPILPPETACLRCVFPEAPPSEMNPTCDTAGVLGPAVHLVAAAQAMEAIKVLAGRRDAVNRRLLNIDAWTGRYTNLNVERLAESDECICCGRRRFEYLEGKRTSAAMALCGRNAVQINRTGGQPVDLAALARRIETLPGARTTQNQFMLRCIVENYEITVFPDGRAIVKGTNNPDAARSIHAKYIGT